MTASKELDKYIANHTSPESAILNELNRDTNINTINPRMLSGHVQGQVLRMLSLMIKPQYILEIGTFTGYSAICLAEGLQPDGQLHTIEINDELEEFAKKYFKKAGLIDAITQHIGNALEIIPTLNIQFDIIYIDGEKREYPQYYQTTLPYLKPGGYFIVDNVLWDGKVIDPAQANDPATKAILDFNKTICNDINMENILLPVRDGLMVARKKLHF